jgi:chromosome segregation ATPase
MLQLNKWAPSVYDYTLYARDSKILALGINEHEPELKEMTNQINTLNNRIKELSTFDLVSFVPYMSLLYTINYNTGRKILQFYETINQVKTSFEVYDHTTLQSSLTTLKAEAGKLETKKYTYNHSLSRANNYKKEIEKSYQNTLNHKESIKVLNGQLNDLTVKYNDKMNVRNEMKKQINKMNLWSKSALDIDKSKLENEITNLIDQINLKRNEINNVYQTINTYNSKYYYVSWK